MSESEIACSNLNSDRRECGGRRLLAVAGLIRIRVYPIGGSSLMAQSAGKPGSGRTPAPNPGEEPANAFSWSVAE
jgi:hypothetical protein